MYEPAKFSEIKQACSESYFRPNRPAYVCFSACNPTYFGEYVCSLCLRIFLLTILLCIAQFKQSFMATYDDARKFSASTILIAFSFWITFCAHINVDMAEMCEMFFCVAFGDDLAYLLRRCWDFSDFCLIFT